MTSIPFKLGFMGYDTKQTDEGLRQFVDNNKEQVVWVSRARKEIRLKDGTIIRGVSSTENLRGKKFDQLILFDDGRWNIKLHKEEDIRIIKALTMNLSIVPEEFQIIEYENLG